MYACMQLSWHQCQLKIVLLWLFIWSRPCTRTAPEFLSGLDTKNRCVHTQISPCTFREHRTWVLCLDTKCEHSQRFNLFLVKFSGGSRGGAQGPRTPFLSDQSEAQRAEKNVLETAPLHISGSGCPPPLISRSGCDPEIDPVVTMSLHCVGTFLAALLITPAFLAVIRDCMLPTLVMVVSQSETDKSQL